jgi:Cytochrome P450
LSSRDDVYRGFFIPKGKIPLNCTLYVSIDQRYKRIFNNSECLARWLLICLKVYLRRFRAILHDPEIYPDPEEFKPERFLNEDGSVRDDPTLSLVFGIGKRICPGRHFVDATIFIVASSVLSVFNVTKAKDENGHEIPVKVAVSTERKIVM